MGHDKNMEMHIENMEFIEHLIVTVRERLTLVFIINKQTCYYLTLRVQLI